MTTITIYHAQCGWLWIWLDKRPVPHPQISPCDKKRLFLKADSPSEWQRTFRVSNCNSAKRPAKIKKILQKSLWSPLHRCGQIEHNRLISKKVLKRRYPEKNNWIRSFVRQQQQQISKNTKVLISWQQCLTITVPMSKRYKLYLASKKTFHQWKWFEECQFYWPFVPRNTAIENDVSSWGCCLSLYFRLHCLLLFFSMLLGQVDNESNGFLSLDTGSTRQSENCFMLPHPTNSKTKIHFFHSAPSLAIQLELLFDIASRCLILP